jgi:hypothetical protein
MSLIKSVAICIASLASALTAPSILAAQACSVHSAASVTPVIELYTSEGCNSCPPADKWLSKLKAEPSIVALAFHVDYWDRLGWKDRFSSPAYTQRQAQQQVPSGARFSYTPQVIVDGADRPDWPGVNSSIASKQRPAAHVDVQLARDGNHFSATVAPAADAPARLAAYWAVTEQGYISAVKAGENQGVTLNHDYVVREYLPVAAWNAKADAPAATLRFEPSAATDPGHAREVNLVIVNADSGRPVQAVKLGC